jgi:hypothetical protein
VTASVLILTNERDLGADFVIAELGRRGAPVLRCNTEHLPKCQVELIPAVQWTLRDQFGRVARSDSVRGVWWRRPGNPSQGWSSAQEGQRRTFDDQWQALTEGLASVPGVRWISDPAAIRAAEDKVLQLSVARRVGLRVPATIITNDPGEARRFLAAQGGAAVAKTVTAAYWDDGEENAFVFARLISEADLPEDDGAFAQAPVMLQEPILPKCDVRVTVIGGAILAADTAPVSPSEVDWRLQPDRSWQTYELPEAIQVQCVSLVKTLGLDFGGIDLARDAAGEHWFLEINPNGEWGWLQAEARLPIAAALADALSGD